MQRQRDENLMIVTAVEQYALNHHISTAAAYTLFRENGINMLIRRHYNALHTQPLDESYYFAEDILNSKRKCSAN